MYVATSYPMDENDWRGRFIANIIDAFSFNNGIGLRVWIPPGRLPNDVCTLATEAESKWLEQLMQAGGIAHIIRTKKMCAIGSIVKLLLFLRNLYRREGNVDIVHINWIQNVIPLWRIKTPAVISVLGSDFGLLKLPGMKFLIRSVVRQRKCVFAPNADWMVPALENAFGDIAGIESIPFGVDDKWFDLKRDLRLDSPLKWIAVTRLTKAKLGPLFEWGEPFFGPGNELHLFGPMQETIKLPGWIHYHGPASPEELQNRWFPIASGLITLSQHDEGRPQVMLEAMASGLPIIASYLKAHTDMIQHNKTGCIVTSRAEFIEALSFLSDYDTNVNVGTVAKSWIIDNIGTWSDCADRYIKIYKNLLNKK